MAPVLPDCWVSVAPLHPRVFPGFPPFPLPDLRIVPEFPPKESTGTAAGY